MENGSLPGHWFSNVKCPGNVGNVALPRFDGAWTLQNSLWSHGVPFPKTILCETVKKALARTNKSPHHSCEPLLPTIINQEKHISQLCQDQPPPRPLLRLCCGHWWCQRSRKLRWRCPKLPWIKHQPRTLLATTSDLPLGLCHGCKEITTIVV